MSNFSVGEVWMTGWEHTSQIFGNALDAVLASDAGYHEPRAGETESIGSATVEVVHPVEPLSNIHDNIGVRVSFGDVRFLFTGDAEAEHEGQMVARGEPLQAQILQLGHHGSRTSTSSSFLDAVNPEVAIYSAGANNTYGHPHDEVVTRVLNRGIDLYGTDVHGTIRVQTDGATYTVHVDQAGDIQPPSEPQPPVASPPPAPTPTPEPPPYDPPSACINLNTASHEDLQQIIHIGPDRASQIISMRPFSTVDQRINVSGIGPARLDDIKAQGLACVS
jgi:competence protein ComEC